MSEVKAVACIVVDADTVRYGGSEFRRVRTCELEINIDMTAVVCDRCGYPMPKGTVLEEVNYCMRCGRKVV